MSGLSYGKDVRVMSGCDEMPWKLRVKDFDIDIVKRSVVAMVALELGERRRTLCPSCARRTLADLCPRCGLVDSVLRVTRRYVLYTADSTIEVLMSASMGGLEVGSVYDFVIARAPSGTIHVLSAVVRRS